MLASARRAGAARTDAVSRRTRTGTRYKSFGTALRNDTTGHNVDSVCLYGLPISVPSYRISGAEADQVGTARRIPVAVTAEPGDHRGQVPRQFGQVLRDGLARRGRAPPHRY
jgi:hypothetical protein